MTDTPETLMPGEIEARLDGALLDPRVEVWKGVSYPNINAAMQAVMPRFRQSGAWTFHLWQAGDFRSGITAVRTNSGALILLDHGNADAAAAVAALLPDYGYQQFLPSSVTPLASIRWQAPSRVYNMLTRHGFTTIEQVAACPDLALMDVNGMGDKSINALRDVVAETKAANLDGPIELSADQLSELVKLLGLLSSYAQGQGNVALSRRAEKFLTELAE
jgi:hypothetical protein